METIHHFKVTCSYIRISDRLVWFTANSFSQWLEIFIKFTMQNCQPNQKRSNIPSCRLLKCVTTIHTHTKMQSKNSDTLNRMNENQEHKTNFKFRKMNRKTLNTMRYI